ncbi:MAG TPA: hypothetical protein VHD76_13205 [Bryobacteraceae bacterium]|nr:hypothetical protein [Bryobacteraceae bacterium]
MAIFKERAAAAASSEESMAQPTTRRVKTSSKVMTYSQPWPVSTQVVSATTLGSVHWV